jgi:hypothetical protein
VAAGPKTEYKPKCSLREINYCRKYGLDFMVKKFVLNKIDNVSLTGIGNLLVENMWN